MNCKQIEEKLVPYLDGKLNPAGRRQMDAHLALCANCRQRAAEFRMVWDVLEDLPAISPSPAFDAMVRARVANEPRRTGILSWFVPSLRIGFAATALIIFSLWLSFYRPSREPMRAPVQSSETEFGMIQDLTVLEDYDVLAGFDALSELPVQQVVPAQPLHQM